MRINLVTPFAEKYAAKALGARWDAAKKCWYIVDVDVLDAVYALDSQLGCSPRYGRYNSRKSQSKREDRNG